MDKQTGLIIAGVLIVLLLVYIYTRPAEPTLSTGAYNTNGFPAGYGQLTQEQKRIINSGKGTLGVEPVWPRPNLYADVSQAGQNVLNAAVNFYNNIPASAKKVGTAADIRGCAVKCSAAGQCQSGYYFKDMTPGVGDCYSL